MFVGFIGVFFILKPTFYGQNIYAGLIGLFSGFGAGIAYLYVTQLGQVKEPDIRTVFYFTLISTVGSAILLINQEIHVPKIQDIKILIYLGISATIAQIAITRAYRVGNTLSNAGLSYLTIIFSAFFGVIFFEESLDLLSISFVSRFGKKPMHLFGVIGTLMFIVGFIIAAFLGMEKLYYLSIKVKAPLVTSQPYFYIGLTSMIIGVQLFMAGFLGEMISRNSPDRNVYLESERLV